MTNDRQNHCFDVKREPFSFDACECVFANVFVCIIYILCSANGYFSSYLNFFFLLSFCMGVRIKSIYLDVETVETLSICIINYGTHLFVPSSFLYLPKNLVYMCVICSFHFFSIFDIYFLKSDFSFFLQARNK